MCPFALRCGMAETRIETIQRTCRATALLAGDTAARVDFDLASLCASDAEAREIEGGPTGDLVAWAWECARCGAVTFGEELHAAQYALAAYLETVANDAELEARTRRKAGERHAKRAPIATEKTRDSGAK